MDKNLNIKDLLSIKSKLIKERICLEAERIRILTEIHHKIINTRNNIVITCRLEEEYKRVIDENKKKEEEKVLILKKTSNCKKKKDEEKVEDITYNKHQPQSIDLLQESSRLVELEKTNMILEEELRKYKSKINNMQGQLNKLSTNHRHNIEDKIKRISSII